MLVASNPDAGDPQCWRVVGFALATMAGVAGVGLGFSSWYFASARTGVWGTVLLLAAPALAVAGTRRDSVHASAATLESAVDRLDRALLALKFIQGARAVALIGNSFTLILWFCDLGGIISARQFVLPYTFTCLAALALYLPWLGACERMTLETIAAHRRWLKARRSCLGD